MSSRSNPDRRSVLGTGGGLALGAAAGAPALLAPSTATAAERSGTADRLPAGLFTLGVASGDPLPDGVVLWTRLAPDPLAGGGMPGRPVPVQWQVSDTPSFTRIRRRGAALARPEHGHSVHVEVHGLRPDREYWYRFRAGRETSPAGRTRTAPAAHAHPRNLRFLFASCQNWQDGYFTAWHHAAQEDVDFVAFLGDYIYESVPRDTTVRRHEGTGEPYSLTEYRNRHAQYRGDVHLQAAHAHAPWIVTLDDHEIDNNWADEIPQDPGKQTPEAFRARRVAALQAYWEHMPLRRTSMPDGLDMQLYRSVRYGDLATVHVLDTRQYRSDQITSIEESEDPARSITGAEQERWLVRGMERSGARWNLLANQLMWAQNDRTAGPEQVFDFDNWDGYRAQRRRLLEFFGSGRTENPVVLTGDRHCTWVCDLKPDFDDPASPVVGAELTGSSISSGGDSDPAAFHARYDPIMAESPHWKYIDNRRAYVLCDVTRERMTASLRTVDTVWRPEGTRATTSAEFVVEAGRPGVTVASTPEAARPMRLAERRYDVDDDQV
ncbi:alkaline phosphatase D family protein [Streptomyces sp. MAR4 CNX-425]|uniref:alkaline phosphatase D family protein n=1 Tax=Streptomyces sp. MAR4 CNX-425 TaxID=3406343 RepID=UPI003B5005C6